MPTVRTHDIGTYYERRGSGPPAVFVHGAILDHTQWAPQVDALADEYATVTYDVRGHGRTGGSAKDSYSIELFADDLDALLAALDIDDPFSVASRPGAVSHRCTRPPTPTDWPASCSRTRSARSF